MPQSSRTIGIRELKAHASAVLREVQEGGAEFIVTVHGRPVARIERLPTEDAGVAYDGMGNSRGVLASLPHLNWEDFEAAKALLAPRPLSDD